MWTVPAGGGKPVQITNGVQPALGVKASADGERIVYTLQKSVSEFWIINIEMNRAQQIPLTEEDHYSPRFSPDGKKIACAVGAGGYTPYHLFVMDRDGGNRRQLSFGDEVAVQPRWSPDGKKIAYRSRKFAEPDDSNRTYVIDPSNPGSVKYVTDGVPMRWLDSLRIQVLVGNTVYLVSLDGAQREEIYEDSTRATIIQGGKYILFNDYHEGKSGGLWIVDGSKSREEQRKTARLLPRKPDPYKLDDDGKILYSIKHPGELWRMRVPDGKERRIEADFLGVQFYNNFDPSWDGKEVIITKPRNVSNIVMIENLFK